MMRRLTASLAVFAFAAPITAQMRTRDSYGVWIRGRNYDVKEFPYRGVEIDFTWDEIQPSEGVFVWTGFDAALRKAVSQGLYACIGINVGPMSPEWLYAKGIPKVMTTGHRLRTGPYPYYLDSRHIAYYYRLIQEFGRHARSLPSNLTDRIAFVQVKTGSTGDEEPYKGVPTPAQYAISDAQWREFRLGAFRQFLAAFQQGPGPAIPMLYNAIAYGEDPFLWNWVRDNVKAGWGHKQPGTGQAYQLNDEVDRVANLVPHLIDPAPGMFELFTRCEMDQTWNKGHHLSLHPAMGFYWTALSALHSGLSVWNLTGTARDWCHENNSWEAPRFFNKYAGQTHAATAMGAFCALREGLDASDTAKFPESKFGKAEHGNRERYLAICKANSARGARMDDVAHVLTGQMVQRFDQQGFNDAGWNIFRGNYERFLHQIDADQTSVGWWRVGGEITPKTPIYARFARGFNHASGKDTMYFALKDGFFTVKSPVAIRIVYYDHGTGGWALQYDAVDNPRKVALKVSNTDSGTWKEQAVVLKDARFGHRGPHASDLALVNISAEHTGVQDTIFHMIELTRDPPLAP